MTTTTHCLVCGVPFAAHGEDGGSPASRDVPELHGAHAVWGQPGQRHCLRWAARLERARRDLEERAGLRAPATEPDGDVALARAHVTRLRVAREGARMLGIAPCEHCHGTGIYVDGLLCSYRCPACRPPPERRRGDDETCPTCDGDGWERDALAREDVPCRTCGGRGELEPEPRGDPHDVEHADR